MNLRRHCELMAEYHGWAYATLFAGLDAIDDERYRLDCGLFFRSIHGTLNHLLLADLIWYGRLAADPYPVRTLADEIETDRAALRAQLLARSAAWRQYLEGLDEAALAGVADFHRIDGTSMRLPRASCILHVFNHGTHHRGQVSAAMKQLVAKAAEIDFTYFLFGLAPDALGI